MPGSGCPAGRLYASVTAGKTNQPTAGDLRYQLSFGQIARECIVQPGMMTIKVGVQGRIIVGLAGGPGQTTSRCAMRSCVRPGAEDDRHLIQAGAGDGRSERRQSAPLRISTTA